MIKIPILGDIIREVGETVRELVPDADKRMEIEVRLAELADQADARENALLLGQVEVNKVEAASSNLFVAGWRPFIGWICGVTLGYTWMVAPFINWIAALNGYSGSVVPNVDINDTYPIILGMLGLGLQRSFEKSKGVATSVGGVVHTPKESIQVQEAYTAQAPVSKSKSKGSWFK